MSDDFADIIKTTLQTKVLQALKSAPEAIDAMVEAALMTKTVDADTGRPDGYSSRKVPYLEYLVGDTIRDAARAAAQKVIAERQPEIEAAIRQRMSADDMVGAMAKSFMRTAEQSWKIDIKFESDRG